MRFVIGVLACPLSMLLIANGYIIAFIAIKKNCLSEQKSGACEGHVNYKSTENSNEICCWSKKLIFYSR